MDLDPELAEGQEELVAAAADPTRSCAQRFETRRAEETAEETPTSIRTRRGESARWPPSIHEPILRASQTRGNPKKING